MGDDDQLPSVGPGAVLHNLLQCNKVPRCVLKTLFRQDPSGDIARNAAQINQGYGRPLATRPLRPAPVAKSLRTPADAGRQKASPGHGGCSCA